jgi:hypothetical protein
MNSSLEAIEANLPNGFHDALIKGISVDYVERKIVLSIAIWTGTLEGATEQERESYADAVLTVSDFLFCVIDPPDPQYPFNSPEPLRVDSGSGNPKGVEFLNNIPPDAFAHWFFVNQWNSFIYIAARSAHLEMKAGPQASQ